MDQAYLAVKGLKHSLNESFRLEIEELSFKKGEKAVLLGRNGAGKSTLARILALLEKPVQGSVFYRGKKIESAREATLVRKNFSFLVQKPVIFSGSVAENLKLVASIKKAGQSSLERVIELFELSSLLNQKAWELSTGEIRRVQIAMLFLGHPEAIFLDEATSFLDEDKRQQLLEKLQESLSASQTIFFITHRLDEALRLGKKLIVLDRGRVLYEGSFEDLIFNETDNLPSYLDGWSFVRGTVLQTNGSQVHLIVKDHVLKGLAVDSLKPGDEAVASLREESVTISLAGENTSAQNLFLTSPYILRPLKGKKSGFYRVLFKEPLPISSLVTEDSLKKLDLKPGSKVYASIKASSILVYKTVK